MNGLTPEAEAALAYVYSRRKNLSLRLTSDNIAIEPFVEIRDAGMINGRADCGYDFIIITQLYPDGIKHYQESYKTRKSVLYLTPEADELVLSTYLLYPPIKEEPLLFYIEQNRTNNYQECAQAEVLNIFWSDNSASAIQPTQQGRQYVYAEEEDDFLNLTVNNYNTATAYAETNIGISNVIAYIQSSTASPEEKEQATEAVHEMEEGQKTGNIDKFLSGLEKATSIAKNVKDLAPCLLPAAQYIPMLIGMS